MAKTPKTLVDRELIKELSQLLDETGLTEIEIEQDGQRVRVARHALAQLDTVSAAPIATAAVIPVVPAETDLSEHPGVVTSPMVGTAYRGPSPGSRGSRR